MTETRLTRSRPKNPPAKTVAEAEKIKSKVEKSNRKEKSMTIKTRLEDLPPLARKYIEENEGGGMKLTAAEDRPVTPTEMADLEAQLAVARRERQADRKELSAERDARIAGEVDGKATRLMNSDPTLDYSGAVRMALADDANFAGRADGPAPRLGRVHGTDEQMREAVERRMAADPENYPDEATDDDNEPVGSTHDMNDADYQRQLKETAKARGYDL